MDIYTLANNTHYKHSQQVAKISELLAIKHGYSPSEISVIKQAAALHDIGKSDIPAEILNKPGALSPNEYEVVKTHTSIGHKQIQEVIQILNIAATVCKEHHERLDGKNGYIGLIGEDIHPYAKLIAVADVYDALVSKRAYKEPWDIQSVCKYLESQAGRQFDFGITMLLLGMIDEVLPLYKDTGEGFQED